MIRDQLKEDYLRMKPVENHRVEHTQKQEELEVEVSRYKSRIKALENELFKNTKKHANELTILENQISTQKIDFLN